MRKPDEIMAEYLLKGGKMLAKTCPSCGSPLFEYKGDTLCVVCQEEAAELKTANTNQAIQEKPPKGPEMKKLSLNTQGEILENLDTEFALTIQNLLRQAREETDTRRLKQLMQALKTAAEAYSILSH